MTNNKIDKMIQGHVNRYVKHVLKRDNDVMSKYIHVSQDYLANKDLYKYLMCYWYGSGPGSLHEASSLENVMSILMWEVMIDE
jgi:hypothetical protein